ncbi:MAG: carbamoyltransferase C-terminal domain-containing protein, partial [Verrucomicrobiales bacterium]|nr:carbamoyltransferase C-terminal domain-containing protein [Verrucomicrobiales bacterium]
ALLGPGPGEGLACGEVLGEEAMLERAVGMLEEGKVIGWCQGRMEFGPRALGNRSILADPRRAEMQSRINQSVKFREGFRPFAPAVLEGRAAEFFEIGGRSPYMLLVAPVSEATRKVVGEEGDGFERLKVERSGLPAVTHVDFSARVQTVGGEANGLFFRLLKRWETVTGCPVLVNTSFNVRGEPVVCSAADAVRCFGRSGLDALFVGDVVVEREDVSFEEVDAGRQRRSDFADVLELALKERQVEWVKFSASTGVVLWVFWLFLLRGQLSGWWGCLAPVGLVGAALASRVWGRWFYRFGMTVLIHIGHRVGKVLLGVVWLVLVVPTGLLLRVTGKDLLDVKGEAGWKKCEGEIDLRKMY